MAFDLVPPLGDSESAAAVRAALAASGLVPDSAPAAYGTAWRRAAAEEAAGYDTEELQADSGSETRPSQAAGRGPTVAREGVAEPWA
jgi:hypothetical protein